MEVPQRVQGQSPGEGLGAKPETNASFQLRSGHAHVPLGYATDINVFID